MVPAQRGRAAAIGCSVTLAARSHLLHNWTTYKSGAGEPRPKCGASPRKTSILVDRGSGGFGPTC